jgi:hypothetical protein
MNSILTSIKDLANNTDEQGRKTILDTLRDLQYTLEAPYDTLQRFGNLVSRTDCQIYLGMNVDSSGSDYRSARHVLV